MTQLLRHLPWVSRSGSSHEDYSREHHTRGPSSRKFGITLGLIFLAIAVWPWARTGITLAWTFPLCFLGALLFVLGAVAPSQLDRANAAWMALGVLLQRLTSPVVLGIIFFLIVTPMAVIYRAFGARFLQLKWDPKAKSYWMTRTDLSKWGEAMQRQF